MRVFNSTYNKPVCVVVYRLRILSSFLPEKWSYTSHHLSTGNQTTRITYASTLVHDSQIIFLRSLFFKYESEGFFIQRPLVSTRLSCAVLTVGRCLLLIFRKDFTPYQLGFAWWYVAKVLIVWLIVLGAPCGCVFYKAGTKSLCM
jgi:hypothetical protein